MGHAPEAKDQPEERELVAELRWQKWQPPKLFSESTSMSSVWCLRPTQLDAYWAMPGSLLPQPRKLVRRLRTKEMKNVPRAGRRQRLPAGDVANFISTRRAMQSILAFVSVSLGPSMCSWIAFAVPFLEFLQAEQPSEVVCVSDFTFGIEWMKYCWGMICCQFHRKLGGRWRRSVFPLAYLCHPREDKTIYKNAFRGLSNELRTRNLPGITRLHSDWKPEIPSAFAEGAPRGYLVQGMEHMVRNLRKRKNANKLEGKRDIGYIISLLYVLSYLPFHMMLDLALSTFLDRCRFVYNVGAWVDYFEEQYVAVKDGVYHANWHVGAFRRNFARGHPASQQSIEAMNRKWKDDVLGANTARDETMLSVCMKLEQCTRQWCSSSPVDEEKPYGLLTTSADNRSFSGPTSPCEWMVHSNGATLKRPGGKAIYVASISNILARYRADPETVHIRRKKDRRIYTFKAGMPGKRLCLTSVTLHSILLWLCPRKYVQLFRTNVFSNQHFICHASGLLCVEAKEQTETTCPHEHKTPWRYLLFDENLEEDWLFNT